MLQAYVLTALLIILLGVAYVKGYDMVKSRSQEPDDGHHARAETLNERKKNTEY